MWTLDRLLNINGCGFVANKCLCAYQMNEETTVTSTRMSTTEDRFILSDSYISEHEECVELFSQWSEPEQVNFVEKLLAKMCHSQLGQVDCFLRPMLQRDFISALPGIPSRQSGFVCIMYL